MYRHARVSEVGGWKVVDWQGLRIVTNRRRIILAGFCCQEAMWHDGEGGDEGDRGKDTLAACLLVQPFIHGFSIGILQIEPPA